MTTFDAVYTYAPTGASTPVAPDGEDEFLYVGDAGNQHGLKFHITHRP